MKENQVLIAEIIKNSSYKIIIGEIEFYLNKESLGNLKRVLNQII